MKNQNVKSRKHPQTRDLIYNNNYYYNNNIYNYNNIGMYNNNIGIMYNNNNNNNNNNRYLCMDVCIYLLNE